MQPITALSTTEAEYIRLTETANEEIWLKGLLTEMGLTQEAIRVHCDSQSALLLAQNSVYHVRTKHIDIQYHRIRELVEDGEVELVKVHTKENPAMHLRRYFHGTAFRDVLS